MPFVMDCATSVMSDGQNIIIGYRLADGDYSRLPTLAGELVRFPSTSSSPTVNIRTGRARGHANDPDVGGVGSDR